MADTQWPRYQVFLQEKPGSPHQDMGSIHAPDAELALLNARDVFVRRPECANLWIVPAQAIYSKTAQEIRENGLETGSVAARPANKEPYYVFCKSRPAGTYIYLGTVEASSAAQALKAGVDLFSTGKPAFGWWVFPARLVITNDPADIDSLFKPALDKTFRLSTDFHTVSAMRQIKLGKDEPDIQTKKEADDAT